MLSKGRFFIAIFRKPRVMVKENSKKKNFFQKINRVKMVSCGIAAKIIYKTPKGY